MSDVYFIVIPVVVVVIILKLCLIFWRVWIYQRRRERIVIANANRRRQAQVPTARVIGVERSVGPEGFTQRTSYMINQPGLPARQVTRTLVIRPNDSRRPDDPNLPPTYDQAVTGKDKSVKVNEPPRAPPTLVPPQPSAPPPPSYAMPPPPRTAGAPPAYTPPVDSSRDDPTYDTTPLLHH